MRVMVTEDDQAIQLLLSRQIARWGYDVITASDGQEAVDKMRSPERPDIIVMDWMMPRLSGLEACQQIKAMSDLPLTYLLMLTSKHERTDLVAGLEAGADDYLCKPVDSTELHSRLKVAARTVSAERKLRLYADEMEQLAKERAEQLIHADRLVTIGTMVAGIAHEISNPLGAVMGNSELLSNYWALLSPQLQDTSAHSREMKIILKDIPEMLASMESSTRRIADLVNSIKRFYRRGDSAARENYALNDCVANSLQVCWPKLKYDITLTQELQDPSPIVQAAPQQIDQVMINLLLNAHEAITVQGGSKGTIHIRTGSSEQDAFIEIHNDGPAIPDAVLEKIWQAFYTTKPKGSGLGLSISGDIMHQHGGRLEAINCPDGGVCFTMRLPLAPQTEE